MIFPFSIPDGSVRLVFGLRFSSAPLGGIGWVAKEILKKEGIYRGCLLSGSPTLIGRDCSYSIEIDPDQLQSYAL